MITPPLVFTSRPHLLSASLLALSASLVVGTGCGASCPDAEPTGVRARFDDPSTKLPDFLAHPWPSDARRGPGGNLDLSAFPNPTESSTLEDYLQVIAQNTRAYATSAALYASFTGALDPASLPADPMAATKDGSPLYLVDIDPSSPERGKRYPLQYSVRDAASTYLPPHTLVAIPPFGIPLRGDTTYALYATKALKASGGASVEASRDLARSLRSACADDAPASLSKLLAPLRAFFADTTGDADRAADDVTMATVFTTQGAVRELRELADLARAQPVPEVTNLEQVNVRYDVILTKGEIMLPGFQRGDIPYRQLGDGGQLARDPSGALVVDHQERTRVSFAIPRQREGRTMPAAGWPVVLFSHGTGGSYEDAYDRQVADVLARAGIAVVGYDQTLHGPRDPTSSDPNLTFFNLFNPIAARDNIRQGAADLTVMTGLIASGLVIPDAITGEGDARFDASKIGFLGHSQGSLVGAPYLSTEARVKAATFSGLGAILTITMLERKDIVDIQALLESLLQLPEGEHLEELHPVLNLIQTFIEVADPIAYARSYAEDPAPGGARFDVLQVEGFKDFASPARGQEAFATAAHIPLVAPKWRTPPAAELVGPLPEDAPATGNVTTPNGTVTFGLIQYPEETHFPIYENQDANARYAEFLRSGLIDGRARIIPATR